MSCCCFGTRKVDILSRRTTLNCGHRPFLTCEGVQDHQTKHWTSLLAFKIAGVYLSRGDALSRAFVDGTKGPQSVFLFG